VSVQETRSNELDNSFQRLEDAVRATRDSQSSAIIEAGDHMAQAALAGHTILACGNGGSAADAQHFVAELVSSFQRGLVRRSLPAISLTSNTSTLTAYANDFDYQGVFSRQVEGLGRPGDCLLAISTSGKSVNVTKAAQVAIERGLTVVALVGPAKTPLSEAASIAIHAQGHDTQTIQAVHLAIEHFLCFAIEEAIHDFDTRGVT
jgi:phosphoheptose isomerase